MDGPLMTIDAIDFSYGTRPDEWRMTLPSMKLNYSTLYSLRGDNMAGKTTLVRILAGHLGLPSGPLRVNLAGVDYHLPAQRQKLQAQGVGFSHQSDPLFPPMSLWDNLRIGCPSRRHYRNNKDRAGDLLADLLSTLGLGANGASQHEKMIGRSLETLSGGGRALMRMARAIAWGYKLLFLDEPTADLDDLRRTAYFQALDRGLEGSGSIVLISHHEADHEHLRGIARKRGLAHDTLVLAEGRLIDA